MRQHSLTRFSGLILLVAIVACGDDGGGDTTDNMNDSGSTGDGDMANDMDGDTSSAGGGSMQDGSQAGDDACETEADVASPSSSASDACAAFCLAEEDCNPDSTVEECTIYRNCMAEDVGSEACVAAAKVYWDCLRAQTDICEPDICCEMQAMAVQTACAE